MQSVSAEPRQLRWFYLGQDTNVWACGPKANKLINFFNKKTLRHQLSDWVSWKERWNWPFGVSYRTAVAFEKITWLLHMKNLYYFWTNIPPWLLIMNCYCSEILPFDGVFRLCFEQACSRAPLLVLGRQVIVSLVNEPRFFIFSSE